MDTKHTVIPKDDNDIIDFAKHYGVPLKDLFVSPTLGDCFSRDIPLQGDKLIIHDRQKQLLITIENERLS